MKTPHPLRAWALFALFASSAVLGNAFEIWVAPDGLDTNAGTRETPLASPALALRRLREARRLKDASLGGGAHIVLRGGTYALGEPLLIRSEDSGTAEVPTVIEAAPGELPVLSGGVAAGVWRRSAEAIPGLPEAARAHVWVSEPVTFNGRTLEIRALWSGDRKSTRARTPNAGTMEHLRTWNVAARTVGIPSALLPPGDPRGLEVIVQQQWEIAVLRVKSARVENGLAQLAFHSPESRLEFEHPWPQPILPPKGAGAFFLANRIEFLDQPGEWYQQPDGRIVYWPVGDEDPNRVSPVLPALETLVVVAGSADAPVLHVEFRGLAFRHTSWLRPSLSGHVPLQLGLYLMDAYRLTPPGTPDWHKLDNQDWVGHPPAAIIAVGARHVAFERCRFEQLAMNAVDLGTAVTDSRIEGCVFRDIGGNAILVGTFSDAGREAHLPYEPADERQVAARNRIANNLISDCANEDWGCAGIAVGFARDVTVAHNEIRDASYTGISVGWGWTRTLNTARNHRIHANLIHHVGTRMCDLAGIYTLSAQPGTVISENVVHSIAMSPYVDRPDHWFYLYTDEGTSFVQVRDNWCPDEKFLQNATGPGNVWVNNGPSVSEEIKARAGLEPAYRNLASGVE